MTYITDEGKCYRVACWLDSLSECARRLADVRGELEELEGDYSGVKAVRYDKPAIPRGTAKADLIGDLVAAREERAAELTAEADSLERAARCGERILSEAWEANAGTADAAFLYGIERYARGTEPTEAAKIAGLGRYAAKLSARKIAGMVYDSAPQLFSKSPDNPTEYLGYWEAMLK